MVEMHDRSDVQLLRDYAEGGQEAAFRELVNLRTTSSDKWPRAPALFSVRMN